MLVQVGLCGLVGWSREGLKEHLATQSGGGGKALSTEAETYLTLLSNSYPGIVWIVLAQTLALCCVSNIFTL